MGSSGGGGGRGGRSGGGGGGPLTDQQAANTQFESMPGWDKAKSEFASEDKWGREVQPSVWRKGDKERLYVPWDASARSPDDKNAGYVTKNANDKSRYGKDMSFQYRGVTIVPDRQSRIGTMKRFVDTLTGHA